MSKQGLSYAGYDLAITLLHLPSSEDPENWQQFLELLRQETNADACALVLHLIPSGGARVVSVGHDPGAVEQYQRYYALINPWLPKPTQPKDGLQLVCRSEAVVPMPVLRHTEFFNDWAGRNNAAYSMAAFMQLSERDLIYISLNRADKRGPHEQFAEDLLHLLMPHLEQSLSFRVQRQRAREWEKSIDQSAVGMLFVDEALKVEESTQRAQFLAAKGDWFSFDARSKLVFPSMVADQRVRQAMRELRNNPLLNSTAVRVPSQRLNKRDCIAVLTKLRSQQSSVHNPKQACSLTILEPERDVTSTLHEIASLFQLTKAETRLLVAILHHGGRKGAIDALRLSANTIRVHMRSIFAKTNVTSQGELIRLFTQYTQIALWGEDS